VCVIYAELRSISKPQRQVLVCGRQTRNELVYVSTSSTENQLQVSLHAAPATNAQPAVYFLMEFDGLFIIVISHMLHV